MLRKALVIVMATAAAAVVPAESAKALFHLALLDEVMTSYGGDPNVQFIEVRMLGPVQNFVTNSVFAAFDDTGTYVGDILVVPGNVTNSANGTRWIVGTSDFQTASGLAPDFIMPAGILPTAGGMVCYGGGGGIAPAPPGSWDRNNFANYVDCLAYGTYAGSTNVRIGTPTSLDADGHSLVRHSDGHNNVVDFACGDPATPENNAGGTASMTATTPCPGPPAICPATRDLACLGGFAKGFLLYKESPPGKEKLVAKMIKGPALAQTDLGNPLAGGGTAYGICIYDDADDLVVQLTVDRAGDTCDGSPCWKAVGQAPPAGKGYKFKDAAGTSAGVQKILYKGGEAYKSKAIVKGKGSNLPSGVAAALDDPNTAVTVQLRGDDATQCLSVTLTDIKKQEADFFKAK
jgi:hypothetical protein